MDGAEHEICRVERKVAVLEKTNELTAKALELAEKMAAADKRLIFAILFGIVGWVFAIEMAIKTGR